MQEKLEKKYFLQNGICKKKMLCMPKDCCILNWLYFLQDNRLAHIYKKNISPLMYESKAKLFHVAKFYSNCHHVYLRAYSFFLT